MPQPRRDLLDVLRFELDFLERGGYGTSDTPWKPQIIFQDSLACLDFNRRRQRAQLVSPRRACGDCELYQFVPARARDEQLPCHHIPLSAAGQTLATLNRGQNQEEMQEAVMAWLQNTIARLEDEREQRGTA